MVVPQEHRLFLLSSAHNDVGHHGFYATNALLSERYWWPAMAQDIAWYIRTCHLCQLHKTQQISIPPIVASPAPLFSKVYMDTMHLTPSGGYKYTVAHKTVPMSLNAVLLITPWVFIQIT